MTDDQIEQARRLANSLVDARNVDDRYDAADLLRTLADEAPPSAAVLCGCGDQIVPDDAAKCGVCAMQDAEDAARYRFLRDVAWARGLGVYFDQRYGPEEWDERIDAARAPQEGCQP